MGSAAVARVRRELTRGNLKRRWRLDVVKTRAGTELLRNWAIDRRYGGSCGGTIQSRFRHLGAYGTSSVDYWQLRRIFSAENGVEIAPDDVLVDVGCGKGRVLNYWLDRGLGRRIVGIELDERFAAFARDRLASHPHVEVIAGDALESLPADMTLCFLFNPFGGPVMERFADRVAERFAGDRRLRIVYYFPMHLDVFENDPRFVVQPFARRVFHDGVVIRLAA